MNKKQYTAPKITSITWSAESLMLVASPGVGGGYNSGEEIGSRKQGPFEENSGSNIWDKQNSLWED